VAAGGAAAAGCDCRRGGGWSPLQLPLLGFCFAAAAFLVAAAWSASLPLALSLPHRRWLSLRLAVFLAAGVFLVVLFSSVMMVPCS
jgi:hypothetical protein